MSLTLLNLWENLHTRGTIANKCDCLASIVKLFGPVCAVNQVALEVVQARDFRPLPIASKISIEWPSMQ